MKPRDLAKLRIPSAPTLAPDGARVCYALTRIDLEADAYRSQLWTVPTDGSAPPRRLTNGPRDSAPTFSPDGRWIAFLRTHDEKHAQLMVMGADGGEPRQVCEHPLGVSGIAWSPDSTRIAYLARVPEEGRYGTDEKIPARKEPPRRITTLKYRLDGVGYTIDRRAHIFVVDAHAEDAEPLQITQGDFDHGGPSWSPDGALLTFASARHEGRDTDLAADVFVVPAGGGEARRVSRTTSTASDPVFSPDGRWLYFTGHGEPLDVVGRTTGIFAVPADGSEPPRRLTDEERIDVSDPTAGATKLIVGADEVLCTRLTRGAVELCAFPTLDAADDAAEPAVLIGGDRQVRDYDRAGGLIAAVVTTGINAGEVVVTSEDGDERTLTDHGSDLAKAVALRPLEELNGAAPDGHPLHGWLVKPAGPGPHPVLLAIHGGPHTQYGHALFDEAQVYAGAGYAVVLGNPRGSQGYGQAHGRAVVHNMAGPDRTDLLALLDLALTDPDLDGDRVGVMGGSYGGFMSTWLAASTDRFRAAIVERALTAFDSFTGTSDIGSYFTDLYAGSDPERIRAQDPLSHADDIACPTLIIHSEEDLRCPLEQAQRLFERLKRNGVEAELLIFPGECHELSRSGLPSHRLQRFEAILEWWERHLG